ncbi:serine/threonine-protein phosphatase 6 regulatory ankyrin repeat subunit B-like [Artemia franciscana]|uniref:serine/threonine-protein phosphatase 6 regulatory ankyrin repeat subunit B-like n=1 Tax=Artemia franciscana TaxID=6661 RepID=UPI0032DBEEB5
MHRIHNLTKRSRAYCAENEKLHLYKLLFSNRTSVHVSDLFGDTPLHIGAKGKLGVCKLLISNGANVNALNKFDQTPLHYAAEVGKVATCKFLISKGANINAFDQWNNTALHFAAQQGKVDVCRLLISHGARINCENFVKVTPLHAAVLTKCRYELSGIRREFQLPIRTVQMYKSCLPESKDAKKGQLSVCKLLISNGANVNALNQLNETPLDRAAILGKADICKLLISHGTNVKASNNVKRWNVLPLNYAAQEGYTAICELLISNGADINLLNGIDETPLHCAAFGGKVAVCKQLISKGANINTLNRRNETPLDETIRKNERLVRTRAEIIGGLDEHDDSIWPGTVDVFKLLVENGANINNSCFPNRDTHLHFAVRHELLSVCKLIISKGGDVNCLNSENETPLMLSFSKKYVKLTEYLLENEASCGVYGRDDERDIYSSILTWLIKEVSLERAITKKWFSRLCNLIFETDDFSAITLKSKCRKKIREDEAFIKICKNFKGVNIPKELKEYLIYKQELKDLFEENICAEILSQFQVSFVEYISAETSSPRNKKRKMTNEDEQVHKMVKTTRATQNQTYC